MGSAKRCSCSLEGCSSERVMCTRVDGREERAGGDIGTEGLRECFYVSRRSLPLRKHKSTVQQTYKRYPTRLFLHELANCNVMFQNIFTSPNIIFHSARQYRMYFSYILCTYTFFRIVLRIASTQT